MDVDVFYIRGRRKRRRRRRDPSIVKWEILFIRAFYRWFYRQIIKY